MTLNPETNVNVQAPMTFSELVYRSRLVIVMVALAIVAYFVLPLDNEHVQWGLLTFFIIAPAAYILSRTRHGLVIDTTHMGQGRINCYEPERDDYFLKATDPQAVTLASDTFGSVVLLGGRFPTGVVGEDGRPVPTKLLSHLQLATNCMELERYRQFAAEVVPDWLFLRNNTELAVQLGIKEHHEWFRQATGLEVPKKQDSELKLQDSSEVIS